MDGSKAIDGKSRGARPMETVLAGLGGCSAIDVITLLEKMRQTVNDCKIEIIATRSDSVPAVFTKIHLSYQVSGKGLENKKVARAVALSAEKYCSVGQMLNKTATITHDFNIIGD